jgi:hypothetical protein
VPVPSSGRRCRESHTHGKANFVKPPAFYPSNTYAGSTHKSQRTAPFSGGRPASGRWVQERTTHGSQRRRRRFWQGKGAQHFRTRRDGVGGAAVCRPPPASEQATEKGDAKRRRGAGRRSLAAPMEGARRGGLVLGRHALICACVDEERGSGGWGREVGER